jgi:pilus assembly protein CpaB
VVGKTATLELSQRQAEMLAAARQTGSLSLALRSIVDAKPRKQDADDGQTTRGNRLNTIRFGVATSSVAR